MNNLRDTSKQLRDLKVFSGSDLFMQGGHQIINSDRAQAGMRRRSCPWAFHDGVVQALLLRVFPRLETNDKQRVRAGRWARVIQLYFRSGLSYKDTAEEMGEKRDTIKWITQRMCRAIEGLPCSGRKKGIRKRATSRTSLGVH